MRLGLYENTEGKTFEPTGQEVGGNRCQTYMENTSIRESSITADGELRRRIVNFLHNRNVPGLDRVHVEANSGTILLQGRVPSSQARRLCVECCRRVAGVIRLIDGLEEPAGRAGESN